MVAWHLQVLWERYNKFKQNLNDGLEKWEIIATSRSICNIANFNLEYTGCVSLAKPIVRFSVFILTCGFRLINYLLTGVCSVILLIKLRIRSYPLCQYNTALEAQYPYSLLYLYGLSI